MQAALLEAEARQAAAAVGRVAASVSASPPAASSGDVGDVASRPPAPRRAIVPNVLVVRSADGRRSNGNGDEPLAHSLPALTSSHLSPHTVLAQRAAASQTLLVRNSSSGGGGRSLGITIDATRYNPGHSTSAGSTRQVSPQQPQAQAQPQARQAQAGLARSFQGNVAHRQLLSGSPPASSQARLHPALLAYLPSTALANEQLVALSPSPSPPSSASGSPPALSLFWPPVSIALSSISSDSVPSAKDELRSLWKLGWPVAFAIFFRIAMLVTDLAMLGHKNTDWLAGAAAATIWINISSAFLYRAFGGSLNTLCSQAFGAGNFKLVGLWLQQGLLFASLAGVVVGLSWWFTAGLLKLMLVEAGVADLAGTFARWSLLWLPPTIWSELLQRYFQAQHVIMPALVVNGLFVVLNALLNLLLLYGVPAGWLPRSFSVELYERGWEGMGFIGSPIATALSRWGMLLAYWVYTVVYRRLHAKTWVRGWALNRSQALHPARLRQYLLQQCLPAAVGVCLEEWQLQVIAIFATRIGRDALATHNATLEIFFFLTSFMFGLVTAVQIRIAFYLGAGNAGAARQVGVLGLKVSLGIGVAVGSLFVVLREDIGRVYSSDPAVLRLAAQISVLVGSAYVALSVFYTAMAILNGQARPGIVALAYFVGCWAVCLPASYLLGFVADQGLLGLWYGLCIGYATVTLVCATAAYRSDWQQCVLEALRRAESRKLKAERAEEQAEQAALAGGAGAGAGSSRATAARGIGTGDASSIDVSVYAAATVAASGGPRSKRSKRSLKHAALTSSGRLVGSPPGLTLLCDSASPSSSSSQHHHPASHNHNGAPAVDSINRSTPLLDHGHGHGQRLGDDGLSSSNDDDDDSDDDAWNAEEVRFRELQLADQRRAAIMAATAAAQAQAQAAAQAASRSSQHTSPAPLAMQLQSVTVDSTHAAV